MSNDRVVCNHTHGADMTSHQCVRCSHWWATNALEGLAITRYCPDCVPVVFSHMLSDEVLSVRYTDHMDRRMVQAERMDREAFEAKVKSMKHGMATGRKYLVNEERHIIRAQRNAS